MGLELLPRALAALDGALVAHGLTRAQALEALVVSVCVAVTLHVLLAQRKAARKARKAEEAAAAEEGAPAILAIGTANPPNSWTIDEYTETLSKHLKNVVSDDYIKFFNARHQNCGIDRRRVCISHEEFTNENMSKPVEERTGMFARAEEQYKPTAEDRHQLWAEWAPKLAIKAAKEALANWGGSKEDITHVVFHSCTGFKAPGVELDIVDGLGLTNVKRRLGINYMGCFGGFTGMSVAKSFALSDPGATVLLVCVELCSLHFSLSEHRSEMIGNTIFSDGAAAVIIGPGKQGDWGIGPQRTHTLDKSTRPHMQWAPTNHWYFMYLDVGISNSLGKTLFMQAKNYMKDVCGVSGTRDAEWCVHPGGVKILDVFQDPKFGLNLDKHDLRHSYETLRDFGNMSSPTIFFVIKHMMADAKKDRAFCLGFGPGLTIEIAGLYRIGA